MSRLKVTWTKSAIGYRYDQKRTIKALGLKKLWQSIEHDDTPAINGMLTKVKHLVKVERLNQGQ